MGKPKTFRIYLLITAVILGAIAFSAYSEMAPPPNDNCSSAAVITISGGGYDYGSFSSSVSDLSTATTENGEFLQFAPSHTKSVWFTFTLLTRRSAMIEVAATAGSIPNPTDAGVTVYRSNTCLPSSASKLGAFVSSGNLSNPCLEPGTYLIQVSGISNLNASIQVNLELNCPDHPTDSKFDCPANAYVFNSGLPLPSNSFSEDHNIGCQSIEEPSEYACLPLANRSDYVKSSWYVFTTGSVVHYLDFYFPVASTTDQVGYRLLEGNVRTTPYNTLPMLDCGVAKMRFSTRYVEFPCLLLPNTTYTLALLFHRDYTLDDTRINVRQRGVTATGWPMPVTPPVIASNQLGTLPGSALPGTLTTWTDRFDCNSFIIENVCPPANPASGLVVFGVGANARTYDVSTWATFSLATDANVEFRFTSYLSSANYHTRVFRKTIGATCPSPSPATDLYLQFTGNNLTEKCMLAGDYSIQVLSSSKDAAPPSATHEDAWSNGTMGTEFTLGFTVVSLPAVGLFRLDSPGQINAINNLNPLQLNVTYPGTPAVFICPNTVLPSNLKCGGVDKAIYREVNIGDATGDGNPDAGLLRINNLRTRDAPDPPLIVYSLFKGDANQLATAAGTHSGGQIIPGMVDHAGFCIDEEDNTLVPPGIQNFCACVTPGTYTLTSLGNVDVVGEGDTLDFRFEMYKTIHDSRANAESLILPGVPGSAISEPDVFSCEDNLGSMPPCGNRRKLVYREFYLPEPGVVSIAETGSSTNVLSLFSGRASDLGVNLDLIVDCFVGIRWVDDCTPLEAGWYTVVSYGVGPNYTDNPVWNPFGNPFEYMGDPKDIGRTTRIIVSADDPIIPNYNRPEKAYQAGVTDYATAPDWFPNAITRRIYPFPNDTFCNPDTPFISDSLLPCAPGYNRISFYVFEITKVSFIQIRNIDQSFYVEVFPFDVNASPESLLTVPPVYQCLSTGNHYRQLCDLPPGKYTIAIFANDSHWSRWISPQLYVEEVGLSRFDHAWEAYDFELVPRTNSFVDGKPFDTHPTISGQSPSRDVFYCTTGATAIDPTETQCGTQLNPLVYAEPFGTPKPMFLPGMPAPPLAQPWRNLWYTFMLSGSGICHIHVDPLSGLAKKPFLAVYESDANANIPWSTLQTLLSNPGNTIIPGLRMLNENVDIWCNASAGDMTFTKSGCIRDSVRYYVVASFDAYEGADPPSLPNQAIALSIKYDPRPSFVAPYDERTSANVVNGLLETAPPYTTVELTSGSSFTGTPFSLACYTRNISDPPFCSPDSTGKSAWFKFEVDNTGHFYTALQEIGVPNGWYANIQDMTVWKETSPGGPLTEQLSLTYSNGGAHEWLEGCINRGTYYLLVRDCDDIDTIQPYSVVLELTDSPGDFCVNAIPVNVINATPVTGTAIVDCHTIGTDVGEFVPPGNTCFPIPGRKTSWFHATVNAGPMVDLNFEFEEDFEDTNIGLSDLAYRILAGTCGAMTPIVCSSTGTNIITLNCLGPGDYYIQVSMPEKNGTTTDSPELQGTLSLTVTATPSNTQTCMDPVNPNEVIADFIYTSDCQSISLINLSTAGTDIVYLWEFPDGTSTDANPTWIPPTATDTYSITLTVTNTVSNQTTTITLPVMINNPFFTYSPMADTALCNNMGTVTLDATVPGAAYVWDNGSTQSNRIVNTTGSYWVIIRKDGCELRDTAVVSSINATRTIVQTLCPEESINVEGEIFDIGHPDGSVIIPGAHASGCDSILIVDLSFHSASTHQFSEAICEGESIFFNNQNLTVAGTYYDTLTSSKGCDSIVTLLLDVTQQQTFDHVAIGCTGATLDLAPDVSGASYAWSTGPASSSLPVTSAGNYIVSISDANGCIISIESFTVSFEPLPPPTVIIPQPVCNESDVLLTASGSTGEYEWFDANSGGNLLSSGSTLMLPGVQNNVIVYVQAIMPGTADCVSERVAVPVTLVDDSLQIIITDTILCPGQSITLPWGVEVTPLEDESYSNEWQSVVTGCDSLQHTVHVALVQGLHLILPSSVTIQLGDSILLIPEIGFIPDSIQWLPSEGLSCTTCLQTWANPTDDTDYELRAWSPEGCYVNGIVRVIVKRELKIFIPNVFTPNDDGSNDQFTVFANQEVVNVRRLLIFDRWGEAVWQGENFAPDGSFGWDGISWGKPMPSGVYVWMCEIELKDGTNEMLAGDVTLVR